MSVLQFDKMEPAHLGEEDRQLEEPRRDSDDDCRRDHGRKARARSARFVSTGSRRRPVRTAGRFRTLRKAREGWYRAHFVPRTSAMTEEADRSL